MRRRLYFPFVIISSIIIIIYFIFFRQTDQELKQVVIDDQAYVDIFSETVDAFNEHAYLVMDEDNFRFHQNAINTEFSSAVPNRDLVVSLENRPADEYAEYLKEVEDYQFADYNGIMGVFEEPNVRQVAFLEVADDPDDYLQKLLILMENTEDKEDLKYAMEHFEIEEGKTYSEDEIEDLLGLDFSEIVLPNLDELPSEPERMSLQVNNGAGRLAIHYNYNKSRYFTLYVEKGELMPSHKAKKKRTEAGIRTYVEEDYGTRYYWANGDYRYELYVSDIDKIKEDDVFEMIDHSNAQFLP